MGLIILVVVLVIIFVWLSYRSRMTIKTEEGVIYEKLPPKAFEQKMKSLVNQQLIDVRTPKEVAQGKIGNAKNIDVFSKNFKTEVAKLDTTKPTMIYCARGARSGQAAKILLDLGFKEIYDLKGGYIQWSKES